MRTLVYNFGHRRSKGKWEPFVAWIARQVRAERPDVEAIRVQMRKLRVPDAHVVAETGALEVREPYWVTERRLAP